MPYTPVLDEHPTPAQLIDHLHGAGDYLLGLQRIPDGDRSDSHNADIRQAMEWIEVYDSVLTANQRSQPVEATGPLAATSSLPDTRSFGERVLAENGAADRIRQERGEGIEVSQRALIDTTGGVPGFSVGTPELTYQRRRRLFIRDLLTVQPTNLSTVPYTRELNALANETGATVVAQGAAKPEVAIQFVQADAPMRKIAGHVPVTNEALEDSATLRGYIDGRLGYMVLLTEEEQVINGTGVAPNILGIRNTPGIQTQAAVVGDPMAALGLAIGKTEAADGEANGIAMHPTEYWTMITTRQASRFDVGQGGNGMGPYADAPPNIWGMPVVRTRALPVFSVAGTAKALVGSWTVGATLFQREAVTIRTGWINTQFILNQLTLLAEERVGLAIHAPQTFVETTLR